MYYSTRILLAFLLVTGPFLLFAQYDFMKYGRIDEGDLKMTSYAADTTADAVVLGDYGNVFFRINSRGTDWEMHIERHVRIKIFNKNAADVANVSIKLYRHNTDEERVVFLNGTTSYIENGKLIRIPLKKESIFTEEVSEREIRQKFAMPAIRDGCIIEYEYTVTSEFFFTLTSWKFQSDIPCIRSEFNTRIPEFFDYNATMKGYLSLSEQETENQDEAFEIPYRTMPGQGGQIYSGKDRIQSKSVLSHWKMKDIPAFVTEPFMSNAANYISELNFELASYTVPGGMRKSYTDTWESINPSLLEDDDFGKQLTKSGFLDEALAPIISSSAVPLDKITTVYEMIKNRVKWNGRHSVFASASLKKVYANRTGNSADINLMLILALKECGINAIPVVLSTRDNGMIMPSHPNVSQLNHVIASVSLEGRMILLDATDPMVPAGLLPVECINDHGYLVQPGKSYTLALDSLGQYNTASSIDLKLDDNGSLIGKVVNSFRDYAAIEKRTHLRDITTEEDRIEEVKRKYPGCEISALAYLNNDSIYQPLKQEFNIVFPGTANAGMIYVNPFPGENKFENLFKQDKRVHPIDFIYPRSETLLFRITIPEGYEVIEKPENIVMTLPDHSTKVVYSITEMGNVLQVLFRVNINRSIYMADEYGDLKALFTEIVKKQSELIVMKKKS